MHGRSKLISPWPQSYKEPHEDLCKPSPQKESPWPASSFAPGAWPWGTMKTMRIILTPAYTPYIIPMFSLSIIQKYIVLWKLQKNRTGSKKAASRAAGSPQRHLGLNGLSILRAITESKPPGGRLSGRMQVWISLLKVPEAEFGIEDIDAL